MQYVIYTSYLRTCLWNGFKNCPGAPQRCLPNLTHPIQLVRSLEETKTWSGQLTTLIYIYIYIIFFFFFYWCALIIFNQNNLQQHLFSDVFTGTRVGQKHSLDITAIEMAMTQSIADGQNQVTQMYVTIGKKRLLQRPFHGNMAKSSMFCT